MSRRRILEIDLDTGVVVAEKFRANGRRHRDERDGPAETYRDSDTAVVIVQDYFRYSRLHRTDGPARTDRSTFGDPKEGPLWTQVTEEFWVNGVRHRDPAQGPATIRRDLDTGVVVDETYHVKGKAHREPTAGPASISRDRNTGRVTLERYLFEGLLHRDPTAGPALVIYDPDTGAVDEERYYVRGHEVPRPVSPTAPRRNGIGKAPAPG